MWHMEQSKLSTAFFKTKLEGKDMDQLYNNLREMEKKKKLLN